MANELKRCPFCGSENCDLEFFVDAYAGGKLQEVDTWLMARIWCNDCEASVEGPGVNSEDGDISHTHNGERITFSEDVLEYLKNKVIEKWNKRQGENQ